jgi:hypothetical protein
MSFFQKLSVTFSQVKVDVFQGIPTKPFLDATKQFITIFDALQTPSLNFIKTDMANNIGLIEMRYNQNPTRMSTLQKLVQSEIDDKIGGRNGTEGLRWLIRALEFITGSFKLCVQHTDWELSTSFQHAYEKTLSKHHTFIMRPFFTLAMNFVPSKTQFYQKLHCTSSDVQIYLHSMIPIVQILSTYYEVNKLG